MWTALTGKPRPNFSVTATRSRGNRTYDQKAAMLIGCGDGSGRRGTQARKNLTDNIFGNSRALPAYPVENRVALEG